MLVGRYGLGIVKSYEFSGAHKSILFKSIAF
nr:MAG TPA: hypothetical protein [Caudoviricetes sp.]DAY42225.1 MAG TPA: hypothetical protein [Caudoviricetes sp.]